LILGEFDDLHTQVQIGWLAHSPIHSPIALAYALACTTIALTIRLLTRLSIYSLSQQETILPRNPSTLAHDRFQPQLTKRESSVRLLGVGEREKTLSLLKIHVSRPDTPKYVYF
jgi:hypothetical protein